MKSGLLVLTICLAAPTPARGQTHVYTNADLGRPLPPIEAVSPEVLAAMAARQFSAPPQYPDGPIVFIIGDGRPTAGPWEWPPEAFAPIQPPVVLVAIRRRSVLRRWRRLGFPISIPSDVDSIAHDRAGDAVDAGRPARREASTSA